MRPIIHRREPAPRGVGKLKCVILLKGPDDRRSEFINPFTSALNSLLSGIEIDIVTVGSTESSSSTSRNDFKRFMLNHRKIIVVDQEAKTKGSWERFINVARSHKDIKVEFICIELNDSVDKQFSKTHTYIHRPSHADAALRTFEIVSSWLQAKKSLS